MYLSHYLSLATGGAMKAPELVVETEEPENFVRTLNGLPPGMKVYSLVFPRGTSIISIESCFHYDL